MEIKVIDYYDNDEEVPKNVTEAETVGKSKPVALKNNKISLHKPGDVVRDNFNL